MQPLVLAPLRRLWRDGHTLQLGTDPRLATIVDLVNPATARVLDLLDGTRAADQIVADAAGLGVPAGEARELLDALGAAGLVVGADTLLPAGLGAAARDRLDREAKALALAGTAPRQPPAPDPAPGPARGPAPDPARGPAPGPARGPAPDPATGPAPGPDHRPTPAELLRRRAAAHVLVAGHGWLGAPIAAALAAAGIGHVDPALDGWTRPADAVPGGLQPADAHRPRASAAADAVRRAAPDVRVEPLRSGTATFVVRVGTRPATALATRGVRERAAPRLDVYLRDGVVVVGPLVTATGSPCGECLELHRRDRDAAWPALAAQLATGRDSIEPCAVTTALAATAYAVAEVLNHVDGRPVRTRGATVEITEPGAVRRRSWPPHPRCDCYRRTLIARLRHLPDRAGKNDFDD